MLLTMLAVVVGIGALVAATGSVRGPAVATIAGGLLGGAVLIRASDTPLGTALASTHIPLIGVLALAGVGISLLDAGVVAAVSGDSSADLTGILRSIVLHLGVAIGAGLGALGAIGTLRDGIGDGGIWKLWQSGVATNAVIVVVLGAILAPRHEAISALPLPSIDLSPLFDLVLSPSGPGVVLVTFWALVLSLVESTRITLTNLPLAELVSRSQRERISKLLLRADKSLKTVTNLSLVLGLASFVLFLPAFRTALFEGAPVTRKIIPVLATPALRSLLLALTVGLFMISFAIYLLQRLAGQVASALGTYLPAAAGGILAIVFATVATPLVGRARSQLPRSLQEPARSLVDAFSPVGLILAVMAVAVLVLLAAMTVIVGAGALRYVPSRGAGGAFAATGLVVGAVSVGATGGSAIIVFVVVALGVLAWDASEHGVITRAELKGPATGIEAVHIVGSLAVAGLGVGVAWLSYTIFLGAITVPEGSLPGAIGAIVASLLVLGVLRG